MLMAYLIAGSGMLTAPRWEHACACGHCMAVLPPPQQHVLGSTSMQAYAEAAGPLYLCVGVRVHAVKSGRPCYAV